MTKTEMSEVNRRKFLKSGSFATLMTMLGGVELVRRQPVQAADLSNLVPFQVKCAVIGLGVWGREIVGTLSRLKTAQIMAVCDTYPASLKRAAGTAPNAQGIEDYRRILDDKAIQAVIVATPSHLHREIVLAALQAGKHVYCESPLAHTVEDAKAIAQAAKAARKQVFQSGHQMRSDPQRRFLLEFIRSGSWGRTIKARLQWHKKQSWRFTSPNPEREREINWRLNAKTSPGMLGELAIQQLDAAAWFLNARPLSVTGFSSLVQWDDGRNVPDSAHTVFEYPGGVHVSCECTLANSFDADYELYYGTDAAIMVRGNKAWMFKEVDSPLLGWEVYARKDQFYRETGIALVMDASKSTAQVDGNPENEVPALNTALQHALEAFLINVNAISTATEDFVAFFGANDASALTAHLDTIKRQPVANYQDGYAAAVMAIKANEAAVNNSRIKFQNEWFELG